MSQLKPHDPQPSAAATRPANCAVVTVSDTRTPETDYGGRTVAYTIVDAKHQVVRRWIVRNDPGEIKSALGEIFDDGGIDAAFFTGGTGLGRRDHAFETISAALEKPLSGFPALFAYLLFKEIGSAAVLLRACAGVTRGKVIASLPASQDACQIAMQKLLIPQLGTLVRELKKDLASSRDSRPG